MSLTVVTISSDWLAAGISPLGAELQHLTTRGGHEYLWNGDPAFWTGRAPVLFPVIGELHGGCYNLDGMSYPMPKHGFARHSSFQIIDRVADAVCFRLTDTPATRDIYPFAFQLDIRFSIAGAQLTVAATITNLGDTDMPASFGFHPALCWPLPNAGPRAEHRLRFEADEPAPMRRIDQYGFLLPLPAPTPIVGDALVLRDELFVADAMIFDHLASRRVRYGAQIGPAVTVEFADFPTLGVWSKPGAGFVCIEPWQGFSDPVGFLGDIRVKPGIITIAPGEGAQFSMRVRVED